ncbi:beta-lactamase regulating signal transducer with metallopeptidase domain [Pedobacter sp. AK013]|uniref:M56 family metallopeptidase n=1 Tax=Pedobacter sp. AK013 TaxID=2723071 RepID=UPI001611AFDF|nr:M56 family metallopeptidase [Pedobacter sp. AK013]MBB6237488.1 beta-lactamase regulating signal transducer with metallopeptidase domain [Pedobacter sp. AK013]
MKVTYLNQWLNDQEVIAICWTLFHSIWIGLIIAVMAGIVVACTRKSSADLRYRLFCCLLVLFVISISVAGMYELAGTDAIPTKNNSLIPLFNKTLSENQVVNFPSASFREISLALLNQNASWLFGLWLVFFLFKSLKLVFGLFYIQRIRSYKIEPAGEKWALIVQKFSHQMNIKKRVEVIQSTLVKVPVVLGYFKPLIVLPVGLLLQLPAAQVEAIIWHELAHIYRRDYLINILQKMIEAIFFFNPAVLWLSALIREERESCCDDIVLANVQQKTNYLAALVAFHSPKNTVAGMVMGLSLRSDQLMNRLRRMVNKENKRLSGVELAALLAGLMLVSAFTFIPEVKPVIKNGAVYIKKAVSETLTIANTGRGQTYKPATKPARYSGSMVPVQTDVVQPDTLIKFKSIRFKNSNEDKNNRDLSVIDGQGNRYHLIVANGKLTVVELNEQAVSVNEFSKFENLLVQIDHVMQQKFVNPSPEYVEEDQNMAKKNPSGWQKPDLAINKFSKDNFAKAQVPNKKIPLVDASDDKARVLGVIASLVEHNVISDDSSIDWFALTEDQLVVNGQKQDSQLHRQLKLKYGIKPAYGLFFGPSKVHGTGIFFDKQDL